MSRVINIHRQPRFRDNVHLRTQSMSEYLTTENLTETANGLSRVLDCKQSVFLRIQVRANSQTKVLERG